MNRYDPYPWLEGERISQVVGRVTVKCPAENGHGFVAKKVGGASSHMYGQAYMLKYATEVAGVQAPKLHQVYKQENAMVMVTDFDSGVGLDTVWKNLDNPNKISIKKDLQEQIRRMRVYTKSSIGRVNSTGQLDPRATFRDPYQPETATSCTAFATEEEFDHYKVTELRSRHPVSADRLRNKIQKLSGNYSQKFVLTHGDLNARNIQVKRATEAGRPVWRISAILDWEHSGFFPEYMEYAQARISMSHNSPRGWRDFLVGLLEEMHVSCSEERVEAEDMAMERIMNSGLFGLCL
jgi:Phosphotransferase enzyme family